MRMNSYSEIDAKYVINKYSEKELANMLFEYGELRESRKIARAIVQKRKESKINNTKQLIDCIKNIVPEKIKNQFLSRVFQAIRIEVNDEICALKEMLIAATELLKKGGRLFKYSGMALNQKPYQPTTEDLHKNGKNFPPNFLHKSWMDYLYWDVELES